jgi:hypothetical protein
MSMHNIAQFTPYDYVNKLWNLVVPGYSGYPGGMVSLTTYLSANSLFGGASTANGLLLLIRKVVKGKPEASVASLDGFSRVFSGQGMPNDIVAAMSIVNKYQDEFRQEPSLKKFFAKTDFLQEMVDGGCFGHDCIGFVGTYLAAAGVTTGYEGRRPLDYLNVFKPASNLDDIGPRSVVTLTNGMHIQMIDELTEFNANFIKVFLCQSSTGGPQCNAGVTLSAGGGDYLPVETFRAALAAKTYQSDFEADNAARKGRGEPARVYEMYLRSRLTEHNKMTGYMGGAIFHISADGNPANPVGGSVYVGTMPGGLSIRTPGN